MTNSFLPSNGTPLPPRHRPNLEDLAKGTTESDLWDLGDAEMALPEDATQPGNTVVRSLPKLPLPRQPKAFKTGPESTAPVIKQPPPVELGRPVMQVGKVRIGTGSGVPMVTVDPVHETLGELGGWDDLPPESSEPVQGDDVPDSARLSAPADPVVPSEAAVVEQAPSVNPPPVGPGAVIDEFSPRQVPGAEPLSFRPRVAYSLLEKLSLAGFVLILAGLGVMAYRHSIRALASENRLVEHGDFPIRGKHLVAEEVTTYWRAPILEGEQRDKCRRGTLLLPVVELRLQGGPAAVRVFFRNEDGELVGDAVTRATTPGGTLVIPATAGFEDSGMYAAYRTGSARPWSVEVHEAVTVGADKEGFTQLFEMGLSRSRR